MPEVLQRLRRIDPVRRIVYELGTGRAIDNTCREADATRSALTGVRRLRKARLVVVRAAEVRNWRRVVGNFWLRCDWGL